MYTMFTETSHSKHFIDEGGSVMDDLNHEKLKQWLVVKKLILACTGSVQCTWLPRLNEWFLGPSQQPWSLMWCGCWQANPFTEPRCVFSIFMRSQPWFWAGADLGETNCNLQDDNFPREFPIFREVFWERVFCQNDQCGLGFWETRLFQVPPSKLALWDLWTGQNSTGKSTSGSFGVVWQMWCFLQNHFASDRCLKCFDGQSQISQSFRNRSENHTKDVDAPWAPSNMQGYSRQDLSETFSFFLNC